MGAQSLPATQCQRPAGCPVDTFAGHPLYPIPEHPQAYPWGQPIGSLVAPLVCTLSHALFWIDGRFFVGAKSVGGIRLHAGLTRDGWIQPNGAAWTGSPALIVAAAAVIAAMVSDAMTPERRELVIAASVASLDAAAAIRSGVGHG